MIGVNAAIGTNEGMNTASFASTTGLTKTTCSRADAVHDFITRHAAKITGVLRGFDRLLFRGHLTRLCFTGGIETFLRRQQALRTNFEELAQSVTTAIREESERLAAVRHRPYRYLESSTARKEDVARKL